MDLAVGCAPRRAVSGGDPVREFAAADETRRKRRELAHGKTREQSADEHTSERELTGHPSHCHWPHCSPHRITTRQAVNRTVRGDTANHNVSVAHGLCTLISHGAHVWALYSDQSWRMGSVWLWTLS